MSNFGPLAVKMLFSGVRHSIVRVFFHWGGKPKNRLFFFLFAMQSWGPLRKTPMTDVPLFYDLHQWLLNPIGYKLYELV
jgi:hypothetical protein